MAEKEKFGVRLQSLSLTEYIDGTSEEPDKTTKLTEWVKWKKEMSRTAVILLGSVEQSLHVNLINCTTPKEMWEKLSKLYGDTSEDAKQLAWQQYYEFHIKDGQSITTQIEIVKFADNKVLPTAGIGTVEIQVVLNGKVFERRLSKVLYVPGLKRNLFSVGAATEKNLSLHCFKDHCEVTDKEGILSAVDVRNGKLFHMNFLVKTVECNVATSHSLKLWHERFSHISVQRIKNTSRVSAVRGLEINDTTNFLCESCIMANQTCKPHFPSKQEKVFKPGEMIHSDVKLLTAVTPTTYEKAVSCPEARKWQAAMKEKMDALQENNTWTTEGEDGRSAGKQYLDYT
ncbi:GAG-pre-integrase domain [Popillia japonica]|uniref:GAG-pre-integrase domain n=1 Tax=Popillia japonica TaxID=7064 RepID=A0AAW1K3V2_POPJA